MNVVMISPDLVREMEVEWLDLMTASGSRIIMKGHAPLVEMLMPRCPISMKLPGGAIKTIPVAGGVMSVTRTHVLIVLES